MTIAVTPNFIYLLRKGTTLLEQGIRLSRDQRFNDGQLLLAQLGNRSSPMRFRLYSACFTIVSSQVPDFVVRAKRY